MREAVAVVGIGCRVPRARGPNAFFDLLANDAHVISEVPPDRWDAEAFYDPDPTAPGKMTTKWGGFIEDVHAFDWRAFGIPPREARLTDPQARLLLQCAWEAFEDAGWPHSKIRSKRGAVITSMFTRDYDWVGDTSPSAVESYQFFSTISSMAANRISHFFDLRGPSYVVDCSCASSLTAVSLACEEIWSGRSEFALVGAASLILTPHLLIAASKAGGVSPTGRCRAFDHRADGMVRGEGVSCLLLKPVRRALEDKDRIYGVIRGVSTAHSGRSEWLMAPSAAGQERVIRSAYQQAEVSPGQVQYVELHGPGTPKGDPIEARGLSRVISEEREPGRPCLVGSVKTNLGHTDAAAGLLGLTKVALSMKAGMIPASLHYEKPNPEIPLERLNLEVVAKKREWPAPPGERVAGVTAIGLGGMNAHAVLTDEHLRFAARNQVAVPASFVAPRDQLLVISARGQESLKKLAHAYREQTGKWADDVSAPAWSDVAASAAFGRDHSDWRLAMVANSAKDAHDALEATLLQGETGRDVFEGHRSRDRQRRVVFLFPGQGGHWARMGVDLLSDSAVFSRTLNEADVWVRERAGWSLIAALAAPEESSSLAEPVIGQPVQVAFQVGLARMLMDWGVTPSSVAGVSLGEIPAAVISGALSFEDGIRVALERGRACERMVGQGSAGILGTSREEAQALIASEEGELFIGGVNSPKSVLLSGKMEALVRLEKKLEGSGTFFRIMRQRGAYPSHCRLMGPALGALKESLEGMDCQLPEIPFFPALAGAQVAGRKLDGDYWCESLAAPTRYIDTARALAVDHDVFLEVSPHPTLLTSTQQTLTAEEQAEKLFLPVLRKASPGRRTMLAALARLHCAGVDLDLERIVGKAETRVQLPLYAWDGQKLWKQTGGTANVPPPGAAPVMMVAPSKSEATAKTGTATAAKSSHAGASVMSTMPSAPEPQREQTAVEKLTDQVRHMVAGVCGLSESSLGLDTPLAVFGFDSMMTIELRNGVKKVFDVTLTLQTMLAAAKVPHFEKVSTRHVIGAIASAKNLDLHSTELAPLSPPVAHDRALRYPEYRSEDRFASTSSSAARPRPMVQGAGEAASLDERHWVLAGEPFTSALGAAKDLLDAGGRVTFLRKEAPERAEFLDECKDKGFFDSAWRERLTCMQERVFESSGGLAASVAVYSLRARSIAKGPREALTLDLAALESLRHRGRVGRVVVLAESQTLEPSRNVDACLEAARRAGNLFEVVALPSCGWSARFRSVDSTSLPVRFLRGSFLVRALPILPGEGLTFAMRDAVTLALGEYLRGGDPTILASVPRYRWSIERMGEAMARVGLAVEKVPFEEWRTRIEFATHDNPLRELLPLFTPLVGSSLLASPAHALPELTESDESQLVQNVLVQPMAG